MSISVYTDLSGKELHRQVSVGILVTSGSLCGVMVEVWDPLTGYGKLVGLFPSVRQQMVDKYTTS